MSIKCKEETEARSRYWKKVHTLCDMPSTLRFNQMRHRSLRSMGWAYTN